MDKLDILEELEHLLNIPQIEKLIFHKIEELRNIYEDEIEIYMTMLNQYIENTYGKIHIYEANEADKTKNFLKTYRFEIDKNKENKWKITELDPHPPVGQCNDEIVPFCVIQYMASFKINPTKIESINNFSHPKLKKIYNLRFTRYSETHILGTITEVKDNINRKEIVSTENELSNLVNIDDCYKNDSIEVNYRELICYLEKYPIFREHTFSEFFMKWKPLIDEKLLKLDAQ